MLFHEAALCPVSLRKNSARIGSTTGTLSIRRPRRATTSQNATSVLERRRRRSAETQTCWRAQISFPRARRVNASSRATLIIAYQHSHRRTASSNTSFFSRGRALIQSSQTPSDDDRMRPFRLKNTLPPRFEARIIPPISRSEPRQAAEDRLF
jgi:hypothetical protein